MGLSVENEWSQCERCNHELSEEDWTWRGPEMVEVNGVYEQENKDDVSEEQYDCPACGYSSIWMPEHNDNWSNDDEQTT